MPDEALAEAAAEALDGAAVPVRAAPADDAGGEAAGGFTKTDPPGRVALGFAMLWRAGTGDGAFPDAADAAAITSPKDF